MITSYAASFLLLLIAMMGYLCVSIIRYALKMKGDVSAQLSHGRTTFRIDAKEKRKARGIAPELPQLGLDKTLNRRNEL